jgi:hypothetical protein
LITRRGLNPNTSAATACAMKNSVRQRQLTRRRDLSRG